MSNQIRVSTQWLQDCARQLQGVQAAIENTANKLANIDMDEESGGNKRLSYSLRLRSCGGSYRGSNAREAVRASVRGLQALAREVERSCEALRRNADSFEDVEQLVHALFTAVGAGDAAGQVGKGEVIGVDASYKIKYYSTQEVKNKNRAAWESQDALIDTDYNRVLTKELKKLILTDPSFSEARWKACTTPEQKERFIQELYSKIAGIYKTELSHKLMFVYENDFNDDKAPVTFDNGEKLEYDSGWGAVYYHDDLDGDSKTDFDAIVINVDSQETLSELVGTLCHENRHNLQDEIIMADSLEKYAKVGSEDYGKIMSAKERWIQEESDRYVITDADVENRAAEIENELSFFQKIFYNEEKVKTMAYIELFEDYASAQKEVDARYIEEFAVDCMGKRTIYDAVYSNSRGGGGGGGGHGRANYGAGNQLVRNL